MSVVRMNSEARSPREPVSGGAMDKVLERRGLSNKLKAGIAAGALAVAALGFYSYAPSSNSQTVAAERLTISTVERGTFDDFLPLRARVEPLLTVYLDSIEGGRIEQALEHVADVDDHRALGRLDGEPAARIAVEQFQPRLLRAEQQGDEVDVLMRTRPHTLGIGRDGRIVEQAEDRVAILHRRIEPVRIESEMDGDRGQQLVAGLIEGGEKLEKGVAEPLGAIGPDVRGHVGGEAVTLGQLAADVPEFLEVDRARALGDLRLERRIAARTAAALDVIAALLLGGQREQRLGLTPRALDQVVRDAMVGHDREAEAAEGAAEIRREALRVAVLIGEAEGGNGGERGVQHHQCPNGDRSAIRPRVPDVTIASLAQREPEPSSRRSPGRSGWRDAMGGELTGMGSGDNNYDEEGYDESQRAEILEATRDGPSDGTLLTDLDPDLGDEDIEDEPIDELDMEEGEIGDTDPSVDMDDDDADEDDVQDAFDAGEEDDDDLDDADDVALRP